MLKKYLLSAICLVCSLTLSFGQNLSESEKEAQITRISEVTKGFKSISCDFLQVRESSLLDQPVKSTGSMYYKASDKLRLDYRSPEAMSYIINGSAFTSIVGKKAQTMDLSSAKKVSGMFNFIMSCVTGTCIADKASFTSSAVKKGSDIIVTLIPIKKDIKQMFSSLEITFDSKSCVAKTILMNEKGGNVTTFSLSNTKTGVSLSDTLFEK